MFQDAGTVTYRFIEPPAKLDTGKVFVRVQLPNGQVAEGEIEEGTAEEMALRAAAELPRRSVLHGFGSVAVAAEKAHAAEDAHRAAREPRPATTPAPQPVAADGADGADGAEDAEASAMPATATEKAAKRK